MFFHTTKYYYTEAHISLGEILNHDKITYGIIYLQFLMQFSIMIACPLESILILQYQLSCRRHVGIIVSFFRSRLATLWSLYLEKTVLGDGCVGLIIEAMSRGIRINSSNRIFQAQAIKLTMKS